MVLAIDRWLSGGSGLWGNPRHWTNGVPDNVTEDATIAVSGTYTVTLASGTADSVDSVDWTRKTANFDLEGTLALGGTLADFTFNGGDLVLGSAGEVSGGTLNIAGGTLVNEGGMLATADFVLGASGSIALDGKALTLVGVSALDGIVDGNGSAGSVLVITGSDTIPETTGSPSFLVDGATLVDAGTITDTGAGLYLGSISGAGASSLVIEAGATFNGTGGGGGFEYPGDGTVVNAGLIEQTGAFHNAPFAIGAVVDNTGTILAAANDLALVGGGSLGGTLAGYNISLEYGDFTLSPTLAIDLRSLGFEDAYVVLQSSLDLSQQIVGISDSSLELNGHTLTLASAEITCGFGGDGAAGSIVLLTGDSRMNANGEYPDGGQTDIENNVTLVDAGTILQTYDLYIGGYDGGPDDASSLVIEAGATYNMLGYDSDIYEFGAGSIINAGLFETKNFFGTIQPSFDNTGTVLVTSGARYLSSQTQFDGSVVNCGKFVDDGTLSLSGGVTGDGRLAIGAKSLLLLDGTVSQGQTVVFSGTHATLGLGDAKIEHAVLKGLKASDVIDVAGTTVSAVSISGTSLLVTLAGGSVITETLGSELGAKQYFSISSDGAGGSDLTLVGQAAETGHDAVAVRLFAGDHLGLAPMHFMSGGGDPSSGNAEAIWNAGVHSANVTTLVSDGLDYSGKGHATMLVVPDNWVGMASSVSLSAGSHLSTNLHLGDGGHSV